jgi:hypothetical protein
MEPTTVTVLVKNRLGLKVPPAIQEQAGIELGDLIEFRVAKGKITIRPVHDEARYPTYKPTKAEAAAIRRGRAAIRRGEYVTLDQLRKELGSHNIGPSNKKSCKAS